MSLQIIEMKVADLVPYAMNAKQHPAEQVTQIAASIEEFGMNDPVAVWHDADGVPIIVEGQIRNPFKRKAMNGIFCKTDRIWEFKGTINEDVNGYTTNQQTGALCMTYLNSMLV